MNTFLLCTHGKTYYTKCDFTSSTYLSILNNYSLEFAQNINKIAAFTDSVNIIKTYVLLLLLTDTFETSPIVVYFSRNINAILDIINDIIMSLFDFQDESI